MQHFCDWSQARQIKVKLLLSFRVDYDSLIDELHLPPQRKHENWQNIGPFHRDAAARFLEQGLKAATLPDKTAQKSITAAHIAQLLESTGELEDRQGLYRPITLNFAGFLLERPELNGKAGKPLCQAKTDVSAMIENFFNEVIGDPTHGNATRALLPHFITAQATKQAINLKQLLSQQSSDKALKKALQETAPLNQQLGQQQAISARNWLYQKGLIRPLDQQNQYWELSHDFIARRLSLSLAKYREPKRHTLKRYSYAILMSLWLLTTGMLGWQTFQPNEQRSVAG